LCIGRLLGYVSHVDGDVPSKKCGNRGVGCFVARHARHSHAAASYQVYVSCARSATVRYTVDDRRTGRILNRCERRRRGKKLALSSSPLCFGCVSAPVRASGRLRSATVRSFCGRILSPIVLASIFRRHSCRRCWSRVDAGAIFDAEFPRIAQKNADASRWYSFGDGPSPVRRVIFRISYSRFGGTPAESAPFVIAARWRPVVAPSLLLRRRCFASSRYSWRCAVSNARGRRLRLCVKMCRHRTTHRRI